MVHFVGAGSGAVDLITVRGDRLLKQADVIIYAGSLVNPELLKGRKENCLVYDSAKMTLEEVLSVIEEAEKRGDMTVRLHTGDPCLYGAIREQMDALDERRIAYQVCPGVSSFCGAAAALNLEYTLPGISQSVVITRMEGRTPVPEREKIASFASHGATMVIFPSVSRPLSQLPYQEEQFLPAVSPAAVLSSSFPFCTLPRSSCMPPYMCCCIISVSFPAAVSFHLLCFPPASLSHCLSHDSLDG